MTRDLSATIAATACGLWIAAPASAVLPDDVCEGTRVEAEGQRLDDRSVTAEAVELHARRAGSDEIKGRVTAVDAGARTLRVHGVDVRVAEDAEIQASDGSAIELSSFAPGQYAEIEGVYRGGALHAQEIERGEPDPGEEHRVELAGIITQVDRAGSRFQIMGVEVRVTPQTVIEMK